MNINMLLKKKEIVKKDLERRIYILENKPRRIKIWEIELDGLKMMMKDFDDINIYFFKDEPNQGLAYDWLQKWIVCC